MRIHYVRAHPLIPVYKNDGIGRDTYISFNNGGFSQYKSSDIFLRERTDSPIHIYHANLSLCKPTSKYIMNGTGRDKYIYQGMLDEHDKCGGNLRLPNILRNYNSVDKSVKLSRNYSPSKFEKSLINRIFYGKCPGLKDRYMSPKVRFTKLNKDKDDNKNNEEEKTIYDKVKINDNSLDNSDNSIKVIGNCKTEANILSNVKDGNIFSDVKDESTKKNNLLLSSEKKNSKLMSYKPGIIKKDDLMNSVRKIFLYNNGRSIKVREKRNFNTTMTNRVINEDSFA